MDPQRLIEHESFLRALARRLLADPGRADDAVQEAWLAALRKPPAPPIPLREWLAGVVRNKARRFRRDDARRIARERAAARDERDTKDVVQAELARRELVDAVLALDEPYRTVVLLRYYDGLATKEIARRLGVPDSTVRTRLQRAVERLRRRLGGRPALAPLALLAGGIAVMKIKIAVAAASVLVLAAALWHARDPRTKPVAATPPATMSDITRDTPRDADATAAVPQPAGVSLRGVVEGAAGAVRVEVRAESEVVEATVEGERPFAVDVARLVLRAPALRVVAMHPGFLPAEAEASVWIDPASFASRVEPVHLVLEAAATVRGAVSGAERATVSAFLFRDGGPAPEASACATTDAAGRYALELPASGEYLFVAASERRRPAHERRRVEIGEVVELAGFRFEDGATIAGRVTVFDGRPAAGAVVRAHAKDREALRLLVDTPRQGFLWAGERVVHAWREARTDADGRYEIHGLEPAPYDVVLLEVSGGHPSLTHGVGGSGWWSEDVEPAEALTARRAVVAPQLGVDFDVRAAALDFALDEEVSGRIEVTDVSDEWRYKHAYPLANRDRLSLFVPPGESLSVELIAKGFVPVSREVKAPEAGRRVTVRLPLTPQPTDAGLIVSFDLRGADPLPPLPPVVGLQLGDGPWRAVPLAGGSCTVAELEPGEYRLRARPGGGGVGQEGFYVPAEADVVLVSGEVARIRFPLEAGGKLHLLLRDPDGGTDVPAECEILGAGRAVVETSFYKRWGDGGTTSSRAIPAGDGVAAAMNPLAPGLYELRVTPEDEGLHPRTVTATVEAGRVTLVEIPLSR